MVDLGSKITDITDNKASDISGNLVLTNNMVAATRTELNDVELSTAYLNKKQQMRALIEL